MRRELCSWSKSLTKRSFWMVNKEKKKWWDCASVCVTSRERKRDKNTRQDMYCLCVCVCVCYSNTNPKIGGSKAVGGGHIGGGGCVGVEGIYIGQQGAHHCRNPGTHVLGRQTGKVPGKRGTRKAWLKTWAAGLFLPFVPTHTFKDTSLSQRKGFGKAAWEYTVNSCAFIWSACVCSGVLFSPNDPY